MSEEILQPDGGVKPEEFVALVADSDNKMDASPETKTENLTSDEKSLIIDTLNRRSNDHLETPLLHEYEPDRTGEQKHREQVRGEISDIILKLQEPETEPLNSDERRLIVEILWRREEHLHYGPDTEVEKQQREQALDQIHIIISKLQHLYK